MNGYEGLVSQLGNYKNEYYIKPFLAKDRETAKTYVRQFLKTPEDWVDDSEREGMSSDFKMSNEKNGMFIVGKYLSSLDISYLLAYRSEFLRILEILLENVNKDVITLVDEITEDNKI